MDSGSLEQTLPPPSSDARARSHDVAIAIKNGLLLGASLVGTWTVALLVRLLLPRWLGPETFGAFNFAESFTTTFFVLLGLGVDTYIQKEIAVRPRHASDFFGGILVLRVGVWVLVLGAMMVFLEGVHRAAVVERLVALFGCGQLLFATNANLAAMLQARRTVGGLALSNVSTKLVWGAGILGVFALRLPLEGLALAFVASEALRMVLLVRLARAVLGLRLRIDLGAAAGAVVAAFPLYMNAVANTIYGRVDVTMLSLLSNDTEIGWYGSAANFAGLALLVSPLVAWVLLPLFAVAKNRSVEELFVVVRRAIQIVVLFTMPFALFIFLGADVWIVRVFGRAFAPAITSLEILAPTFVFTYVAMISATTLYLLGRPWTIVGISIVGLVLNPLLDLLLVRRFSAWLGPGGAGAGAALALLTTEVVVTSNFVRIIGRRAFDAASVKAIAKGVATCALVIALDRLLRPIGPARLVADAVAYVASMFAFGVVRPDRILPAIRFIAHSRSSHVEPQ